MQKFDFCDNRESYSEQLEQYFVAVDKFSSRVCNILDIPDEILRIIVLHLDARERVPLGKSCERFNHLVFKDEVLLRDLDFSANAHLTSEADLLPYFEDKSTWQHIRRLNLMNVVCIEPGSHVLNYFIGKVNTLVDINVHGIKFKDIQQLGNFLKPLINVERLSVDWPNMEENDLPLCCEVLQQPLKRLTYLSVKTFEVLWSKEFIRSLQLCQLLKELNISQSWSLDSPPANSWNILQSNELKNLEIVRYSGPYAEQIEAHCVLLLPDPEKWTIFSMTEYSHYDPVGFYLEKNVEVCEELLGKGVMKSAPKYEWHHLKLGSVLVPTVLVKEVLKITHENVPEELCCLPVLEVPPVHVLKPKEAKQLLKDPRFAISYLNIDHDIAVDCDVHLLGSAFPNLTELILTMVTTINEPTTRNTHPKGRLRRKGSPVPKEEDDLRNLNLHSSFEMLVKNTPQLRHVTLIIPRRSGWVLSVLDLIPSWKSLKTLHLMFDSTQVRIMDQILRDAFTAAEEQSCEAVIASIKQLLHRCSQLTTFLCEIGFNFQSVYDMLSSAIKGLQGELSRSNLKIKVVSPRYWKVWPPGGWADYHAKSAPSRDESDVDRFFSSTERTPLLSIVD